MTLWKVQNTFSKLKWQSLLGLLTVIRVYEWPQKVHKYAGPFTHILLGLRTDQHLTRCSWCEGPVWAQSASADFKLNLIPSYSGESFWLFIIIIIIIIIIMILMIMIIVFIEETFLHTCGFRKGPRKLRLKNNISKRTENIRFIKHLNQKFINLSFTWVEGLKRTHRFSVTLSFAPKRSSDRTLFN